MRQLFDGPVPFWKYIVPRHVGKAANYFIANVDCVEPADMLCLRYEDLCREPVACMQKTLGFLKLEQQAQVDYGAWIDKRPLKILPEVLQAGSRVLDTMQPYLTRNGYGDLPEA
jgi:hypothetical protein